MNIYSEILCWVNEQLAFSININYVPLGSLQIKKKNFINFTTIDKQVLQLIKIFRTERKTLLLFWRKKKSDFILFLSARRQIWSLISRLFIHWFFWDFQIWKHNARCCRYLFFLDEIFILFWIIPLLVKFNDSFCRMDLALTVTGNVSNIYCWNICILLIHYYLK